MLDLYRRHGIEGAEEQRSAQAVADEKTAGVSAQNLPRAPKVETAVVWKLHPDQSIEPVKLSLGITDHAYTEVTAVLKGDLKEGDDLVIPTVLSKTQAPRNLRR